MNNHSFGRTLFGPALLVRVYYQQISSVDGFQRHHPAVQYFAIPYAEGGNKLLTMSRYSVTTENNTAIVSVRDYAMTRHIVRRIAVHTRGASRFALLDGQGAPFLEIFRYLSYNIKCHRQSIPDKPKCESIVRPQVPQVILARRLR
jgi:hypothetical protein